MLKFKLGCYISSQHADAPKPKRPFPTSPELAGAELPWPPPLYIAGDPPPGRPRPIQDHHKVRLGTLSLFPHKPLAADEPGCQKTRPPPVPCSASPAKDRNAIEKFNSRGETAKYA